MLLCSWMLWRSRVKLIFDNVSHPLLLHLCNGGILTHIFVISSLLIIHNICRTHSSVTTNVKVVIAYCIVKRIGCVVWSNSISISIRVKVIILLTRMIAFNNKRGSPSNTTNSIVNSCTVTCTMKLATKIANFLHVLFVK